MGKGGEETVNKKKSVLCVLILYAQLQKRQAVFPFSPSVHPSIHSILFLPFISSKFQAYSYNGCVLRQAKM